MDTDEETYIPAPITPTPTQTTASKKKPKRKLKPAPIENVTEFDIAQYIRDLPCGLTIGQASAQIPKYRSGLRKSMQRTRDREANYASSKETTTTTAARCNIKVDGNSIAVVIDSGAAASIITKRLMNKLGYTIDRKSNLVIVTANGAKVHSLGEISSLAVTLRNLTIGTPVQVLDSRDEVFILGNDWLKRMNAILDWKEGTLTISGQGRSVMVPVSCTKTRPMEISDSSETEESESEESKSDFEKEDSQTIPVYISDYFSDSFSDNYDYLEFNPWVETESPLYEFEMTENTENPAVYLAQAQQEEQEKNDLQLGPLDLHQQQLFQRTLKDYKDICAKSQTEIGRTNVIKHRIITGDAAPIAQPPYRINPKNRDFLKEEIVKMEQNGIIRKSISPWASPVVIVDKKGGDKRICIDYRKLNAVTKADAYPLPRIDDLLENLGKSNWFTTLDLASGYWQVAMEEDDVEKTAFITPFGLYEFLVMPFGLSYAPGTFQRLMNRVLQDYLGTFVSVYLDDVIIHSKGDFELHMDHIQQVFEKIRRANLKIKLKKCFFCFPNLHFLGHVVGRDGIKLDPSKIDKVKNFPVPLNLNQLRSALGLFSYY
jgi:predicted aspartyl protease